jgi:uncharacterized protein (TIGR02147 family)
LASIFGYSSVSSFLKAELDDRGAKVPGFSLRSFAKELGLSPAYLSQLIGKKKHLSAERRLEVARRLGLDDRGIRYFYTLTLLEQATSPEIQATLQKQLHDLQHSYEDLSVDAEHFKAIADWYHVAILEMTYLDDFDGTPAKLAERLGIDELTAVEALVRLEKLNLIERDADGRAVKSNANHIFRATQRNTAFATFLRQMMELAWQAMDHQPIPDRLVMSQTFCIDEGQLGEAKEITRQYMQRMAGLFDTAKKKTRTYQLNVQFFNLTDGRKKTLTPR